MKILKLGSTDEQVKELCQLLGVSPRSKFDETVHDTVVAFQEQLGLTPDGIVGFNTWKELYLSSVPTAPSIGLTPDDYKFAAKLLACETAALRAVMQVETGGRSGMTAGHPTVLFEGHVFWRELKARGINPVAKVKGYEDVLYPKWDKSKYKGGAAEWIRLEKARRINQDAANASASWGILQIMGNNYKACGCKSVGQFVKEMCYGPLHQLMLGVSFIKSNPTLVKALQNKDWVTFAKTYNGAGYAQNKYDVKLKKAYDSLKK